MHTKILALAIVVTLTPLLATASDGTLTFGGMLQTETCTISGPANFTVTLPTVTTWSLANVDDQAGETPFSISVSGCTALMTGANVYFEDGPNVVSENYTLKNTASSGGSSNVQLVLKTSTGGAINLAPFPFSSQYTPYTNNVSSNAARLNYTVAYTATGAATAGTFQSSVTYSMVYN